MKTESINKKIEWFMKFLVVFLMVFIPSRNVLELFLGTYIKLIPDMLIFISLGLLLIYKKGKLELKIYDCFLLLFLVVGFVNTVIFKGISIYIYVFAVRSIIVYYIMFFVIRNFKFDKEYMRALARILIYVTYVLFVLGVIEKVGDKTILFPQSVVGTIIYPDNRARVYSMFFNPNTYGAFLVLSFFIVIHFGQKIKGINIYKIIAVTSLLFSMSRSSIIIFAFGLVVYGLVFKRKELFTFRFAGQLFLVCFMSVLIYGGCEKATEHFKQVRQESGSISVQSSTTVYDRLNELKEDKIVVQSTESGRIFVAKTGFLIFQDYPVFGTGFGTYGSAASMNWEPPLYKEYGLHNGLYSDNEYIKDLVETGIVGIILLMTFAGSLIYAYRRNFFCVCFCVFFLWFGLFYNVLEVQIVAFLMWGILGMLHKTEDMGSFPIKRKEA